MRSKALLLVLLAGCGGRSSGRHSDALVPKAPEQLNGWTKYDSGLGVDLNGVTSIYKVGVFAVGNGGTLALSKDQGATWEKIDVGTTANLYNIAWVNKVVYVGGDGVVLMSKDEGATWTHAGAIPGKAKAMTLRNVSGDANEFWAVGDGGFAARAALGKLEDFSPESLAWKTVTVPNGGRNFTGIEFPFRAGIIVGDKGFISTTEGGGETFELQDLKLDVDLLATDREFIGGNGIAMWRKPVSGMQVGSYAWHMHKSTDLPAIRALHCITECFAIGRSPERGSEIIELDSKLDLKSTLVSGIAPQLNALSPLYGSPGDYIAVGAGGVVLAKVAK